jgi:hypothetical protein
VVVSLLKFLSREHLIEVVGDIWRNRRGAAIVISNILDNNKVVNGFLIKNLVNMKVSIPNFNRERWLQIVEKIRN